MKQSYLFTTFIFLYFLLNLHTMEAQIDPSKHYQIVFDTGKALDIGGAPGVNTPVIQWDADPTGNNVNQLWKFSVVPGSDGFNYYIQSVKTEKYLQVQDLDHASWTEKGKYKLKGKPFQKTAWQVKVLEKGTVVVLDERETNTLKATAQQWRYVQVPGNPQRKCFQNLASGQVLEVAGGEANKNGGRIQQWDANYGVTQRLQLKTKIIISTTAPPATENPKTETYYYLQFRHSGKVLDNTGRLENGVTAIQWWMAGNQNQAWKLMGSGDGSYYYIQSLRSNKVLEVKDGAVHNGAEIIQNDRNNQDHQKWGLAHTDNNYFQLINKKSGKVLDVAGISHNDGTKMTQWEAIAGGGNQQVKFVPHPTKAPVNPIMGAWYFLQFKHSAKVMDNTGKLENGVTAIQWGLAPGNENQAWRMVSLNPNTPYFYIESKKSGKVLEVKDGSMDGAAELVQNPYTGADHQLWHMPAIAQNGYDRIYNKKTGKCLDVFEISHNDGAKMIQWEAAGDNQLIRFIPFY